MSDLANQRCTNCRPGTPALDSRQQETLGRQVPAWSNESGTRLRREFQFPTYAASIKWVQEVARIADQERHHPDLHIYWRKIVVELWTHTVQGLSENDYIMAAKIDSIAI